MESILHILGTLVTILFVGAVLYSLMNSYKKKKEKRRKEKELLTSKHIKIDNVHQFDLTPAGGYVKYPLDDKQYVRRFPQNFIAISLDTANEQPYSICQIGFAEYENGELKDKHYFYIQPPENRFTKSKDHEITWEKVKSADEFGEYWNAGMKNYFTGRTIVAHNSSYVIGCIEHALTVFGIKPPQFKHIDTLEIAKKLYTFDSNQLDAICSEMDIELEPHNSFSEADATAQFLQMAKKDFPVFIPKVHITHGSPSEEELMASAISIVEREEETPQVMFAPNEVSEGRLQKLLDLKYIEPGKTKGTFYATDTGLEFVDFIQ